MTSGIYLLNFKDQAFYIGQSQDIETRWKQHRDKFLKGKAAEKMQNASSYLLLDRRLVGFARHSKIHRNCAARSPYAHFFVEIIKS